MSAIGTDLVRIARFEDRGESFLRRAFTDAELTYCAGRAHSLAGRWAAKEAVLKALGAGLGEVPLTDIEIDAHDSRPGVVLHGVAAQRAGLAGLDDWQVSISHDGEYAVAVVVAGARTLER